MAGAVDQELLAQRNECLAVENRILRAQLKGRVKLSDVERATLGEIGDQLGRKGLDEVVNVARPDTILAWYRKLVARKFGGSKARRGSGRRRINREVEQLLVRMARENRDWAITGLRGGALANLGYEVCDRSAMSSGATVCRPHRSASAQLPDRFHSTHLALLAGTDFFTAEVLTLRGLVTYHILFFIHPRANMTMEGCGALRDLPLSPA